MNNIKVENNICIITLDNPPHNYLYRPEFIDAKKLIEIIETDKCKAILFTGAGRHFSAGADIVELQKNISKNILESEINKGLDLLRSLKSFKLPIIACIEGSCLGGGLEIALTADIRIASKKALFAFPEVNLDLIPGLGGILNLTQISSKSTAMQMALKGDIVNAKKAKELGFVDYLVDAKTSLKIGLEMAKSMTEGRSLELVKSVVEAVRNAEVLEYEEALKTETKLFGKLARKIKNA